MSEVIVNKFFNPSTIVPMVPLPQGELAEGQEKLTWVTARTLLPVTPRIRSAASPEGSRFLREGASPSPTYMPVASC